MNYATSVEPFLTAMAMCLKEEGLREAGVVHTGSRSYGTAIRGGPAGEPYTTHLLEALEILAVGLGSQMQMYSRRGCYMT